MFAWCSCCLSLPCLCRWRQPGTQLLQGCAHRSEFCSRAAVLESELNKEEEYTSCSIANLVSWQLWAARAGSVSPGRLGIWVMSSRGNEDLTHPYTSAIWLHFLWVLGCTAHLIICSKDEDTVVSQLWAVILESKLLSLAPVSYPLLCALLTSHQLSVKLTGVATLLGLLSLCREIKLFTWKLILMKLILRGTGHTIFLNFLNA